MTGKKVEDVILEQVKHTLEERKTPEIVDLIETDNIGEVIEKLVILHIRTWMLEDKIAVSTDDLEIAALKKKVDICFKIKRPKYVQAINLMIDNSVKKSKSLVEESVKLYKGVE